MIAVQNIKMDDSSFKRERKSWSVKGPEEKEEKGVKKKNVIETQCVSNISTVVEEHFSSENT